MADDRRVIIVGGGLAGIAATCECLEAGCSVTLIDKNPRQTPGNSSKASSGILAPMPQKQQEAGITDNMADIKQILETDPVAATVVSQAGDADWLLKALQVASVFSYRTTAGTSAPRVCCHRNPYESGQAISAMAATLFNVLSSSDKLTILRGSTVISLVNQDLGGGRVRVMGVEYMGEDAKKTKLAGNVILCVGGSAGAAGKTKGIPAACDAGIDGSSLSLATAIGADTERLQQFTVTPFACKYPGDKGDPTEEKFALSRSLCGPGVAIVDKTGVLVDDLVNTSNKNICTRMSRATGPFYLVVGKVPDGTQATIDWYVRGQFMQMYTHIPAAAAGCKIPESVLNKAFEGLGKPPNVYAVEITPATYSCPGGLQVNPDGKVKGRKQFEGLFAAGEAAAGPGDAAYELTGFALLHCIVSGRAAARGATASVFKGSKMPAREDFEHLVKHQMMLNINPHTEASAVSKVDEAEEAKLKEMSKEDIIKLIKDLKAAGPPAPKDAAPAAEAAKPAGPAEITLDEVAKHNKKEDAWIVINGDVLDVTAFIGNHPGGVEAICSLIGKDASADWNAIHKPGTVERVGLKKGAKKIGVCGTPGGPGPKVGTGAPPFWDLPPCEEGEGKMGGWIGSLIYLLLNLANNLVRTFLYTGNLRFNSDRMGTIRSGLFLVFFVVAHSMDNQVTHLGKVQYNSMSYMMADGIQGAATGGFPWFDTYIIMAVMLHASVALKRSWEINMDYTIGSGRWKWLISGLCILFFVVNHLMDFRFAQDIDADSVKMVTLRMPATPGKMPTLKLKPPFVFFCEDADSAILVEGRDIYSLAAIAFQSPMKVLQYLGFVASVVAHLFWAWPKVCTSEGLAIPTGHQKRVTYIGWAMASVCGMLYASIPLCFYIGIMPSADDNTCGF